jgi:hypothetical protein
LTIIDWSLRWLCSPEASRDHVQAGRRKRGAVFSIAGRTLGRHDNRSQRPRPTGEAPTEIGCSTISRFEEIAGGKSPLSRQRLGPSPAQPRSRQKRRRKVNLCRGSKYQKPMVRKRRLSAPYTHMVNINRARRETAGHVAFQPERHGCRQATSLTGPVPSVTVCHSANHLSTQMPKHVMDNPGDVSNRKVFVRDMRLRAEEIRTQRLIDDVKYWRERAQEVRTEAEFALQPITRTALLETVQGYEALASRIEQRPGEIGLPKSF